MIVKFTIPGRPIGKGRPRVTRYGTYTPKKTKDYEELVRRCWKEQDGKAFPPNVPIFAYFSAHFPIPKGASKRTIEKLDKTLYIKRPDSDNIAKGILDALNGLAFPDDSAVMIDGAWKYYTAGEPYTKVTLWGINIEEGRL